MTEKKEHPQAKWLRALANGETLQILISREWVDQSHNSALTELKSGVNETYCRIKPRTVTIGKYEVAEPVKVALYKGTPYYYISLTCAGNVTSTTWDAMSLDIALLNTGMCWLKREDAELAAKAITELLTGKTS